MIALLGAAAEGQKVAEFLQKQQEEYVFFDNNPALWSQCVLDSQVYPVEMMPQFSPTRIIICHNAFFLAIRQIDAMGYHRFEFADIREEGEMRFRKIDLGEERLEIQPTKIVIFRSLHYSGSNTDALYHLAESRWKEKYDVVFLESYSQMFDKNRLRDSYFYHFLTAKMFIGETMDPAYLMWQKLDEQVYMELWHGFPLKSIIGSLAAEDYRQGLNYNFNIDYCASLSSIYTYMMIPALGLNPFRFRITGMPRNDRLLRNEGKSFLEKMLYKKGLTDAKCIYYMPTFRGEFESRSFAFQHDMYKDRDPLFRMERFDVLLLSCLLERENAVLFVKSHPAEERLVRRYLEPLQTTRIFVISTEQLKDAEYDNYDILGGMDILITDYSSVYIDFLLTEKPVIFAVADEIEYEKNRGFMFDPPDLLMAGQKVTTQEQLHRAIVSVLHGDDIYRTEREHVAKIAHKYQDAHATERIWMWIDEIMRNT